jgi:hypothetical protein
LFNPISTQLLIQSEKVVVLIDPETYERTLHTIQSLPDTVYSLGVQFVIEQGKYFREGHIGSIVNGVSIPSPIGL